MLKKKIGVYKIYVSDWKVGSKGKSKLVILRLAWAGF